MTKKTEQVISIYDPAANAYREVPVSVAKKFVESADKVKAQLAKAESEK
jgi:hypothetical protein